MPIKPLVLKKPPKRWAIYGLTGSGKSSFLRALKGSLLVIDADQRIVEVAQHCPPTTKLFTISDDPEDHCDIERICSIIKSEAKGSGADGIFIDSLTTILSPIVQRALLDVERGVYKNRSLAFKPKATLMKLLQDTLTQTGLDLFYLWHLEEGVFQGETTLNHTVSDTERERMKRSLNAMLELFIDENRRGVRIAWSRTGVKDYVIWDTKGDWEGIPEAIEEAIYAKKPAFSGPTEAVKWSVSQGAFETEEEAFLAYNRLKDEKKPTSAGEMFGLWASLVQGACM